MEGEDDRAVVDVVVVVGAGFAGLYAVHRLATLGLAVRAFEAGDTLGGTWYWNRYPGARCDVESVDYSYSFSPELDQDWEWTERFASQAEILRYLEHVADRFDLRRHVAFRTRVIAAHFHEPTGLWGVTTDAGETVLARFLVTAVGCLSLRQDPRERFRGLDRFGGPWYHTAAWPSEPVDFAGQRVAVVGTGSSGVQAIPELAKQAAHVTVFQRTPAYTLPARNRPLAPGELAAVKARYPELRARARYTAGGVDWPQPPHGALEVSEDERRATFEEAWRVGGPVFLNAFNDLFTADEANALVAEFIRDRIRATVRDPATAELLCPRFPIGAKRPCIGTDYYETFDRPNVSLVDLNATPIVEVTERGIRTTDREHAVDAIVFAIGFDAVTGPLLDLGIRGRGGARLRDAWVAGPRTYLGLMTAGFPNLLMVTGPQSPSVLTNVVVSIEQHVEWIADAIEHLRSTGLTTIEATVEAQDAWVEHVNAAVEGTVRTKVPSSYFGDNVPGKPHAFLAYTASVGEYRRRCDEIAADGYRGFVLSSVADRLAVAHG